MAHTLTFNNSDFSGESYIKVNGVVVTSPYTITSNATIKWTFFGKSTAVIVNGVRYETGETNKLTLKNTDIDIIVEHSSGVFTPSNEGTIDYTESVTPALTFKHFFDAGTIGSGTVKFRHYSQTEPLPQLATPQNVSASGTTVSWDAVENATSYAVLADGNEIGTVEVAANLISFTIGGTEYQAEEGMTWEQWCNSSYNTDGYGVVGNDMVGTSMYQIVSTTSDSNGVVSMSNIIENGYSYQLVGPGSGN